MATEHEYWREGADICPPLDSLDGEMLKEFQTRLGINWANLLR